jgi:4-alpha-glucanotransferase
VSGDRPALRALASRLGVEEGYTSALDQRFVPTRDATREALVAAMGWDASTERAARRALAELEALATPPDPEPAACLHVRERLGDARAFGLWTNLYSVRSSQNQGFGNLADLRALIRWAGGEGAAFVGLNPLHALDHAGDAFCPYAPVSRIFRDPLYLDVAGLPGLEQAPEARAALERQAATLRELRAADTLDPRAVEQVLHAVLRPLHARMRSGRSSEARRAAYDAFRASGGEELRAFATFQALADAREAEEGSRDWRRWPRELHAPDSAAVRAFREAHPDEVDFHAWMQFELETQLEAAGREARRVGMAIGLYADLALGSSAGGFDTWARPQLFARGASVGAPPDAFSRAGQDWGFPPIDPHALRRDGFAFWRRLLEANLCGAGALRIDHALGLRRLFWIPEGRPPAEGAYVRSPESGLLAVLGETSRRLGALVIGEDLGTVPEGFSRHIQERGLLSSRVLLFERDEEGFHDSGSWPELCLATLNTHDLPPLCGWLSGEDLELRRATGQIPDDATAEAVRVERRADRDALAQRLEREGDLPQGERADDEAWLLGTTRFLCRTPAVLVGLSLDDLAGERIPINLPGVSPARHRSWVRRMGPSLEALRDARRTRRALDAVPVTRRRLG